jgi:hypothetical protein
MLNRINVKPSEIKISSGLCGSQLGKSEKETIACNIIVINKKNGDEWRPFSWDDYCAGCSHEVTDSEKAVLDQFVKDGLLALEDDKYSVNDAFVAALWKFVTI